jgi:hypothetical protein
MEITKGETLAKGDSDVPNRKLTLREYALRKGVTLQTVYQKLWAGRLKAEKVDGKWLIEIEEK